MDTGYNRNDIINKLNLSVHGKLEEYFPIASQACKSDPEFLAKLIAWDFVNGQIKDSKVALPVVSLASKDFPDELCENSLAHLALQPPRELRKAFLFAIQAKLPKRRQVALEKMVRQYLRKKEEIPGKWVSLAVRHRRSLKSLYKLAHSGAPEWVSTVLFGDVRKVKTAYPPGSIFADIASLSHMASDNIAATIQKWHLSPLVVTGAMAGSKGKQHESRVVEAGIAQMSDTELVTRTAGLEKRGAFKSNSTKEAFRRKALQAVTSKKATLKTSEAAEAVEDDAAKQILRELQERQIQSQKDAGRGIDGNWLVIIDKSDSQSTCIEIGKQVAAAIAKFVTGKVYLAFCDTTVSASEVTGLSLEAIRDKTKYIRANGATSYGVGLEWASRFDLDGIAVVGDGAENSSPFFSWVYAAYCSSSKKQPPVYLYKTASTETPMSCLQFKKMMDVSGIPFTEYDFRSGKSDYYSLSNTVQLMNVNRFTIIDKIMAAPLVTLAQVFGSLTIASK